MASNDVIVTRNAADELVITVCFFKTKGGKSDYRRFTGYSSNALLEKVQVSRRDLQRRFGDADYFAVIGKLLTLQAMVLACKQPLLGKASVFEASWGKLPIHVSDRPSREIIEGML